MQVMMLAAYDIYRKRKYEAGVLEHRGGDPNAPFNGDIVQEVYAETLDISNYAEEMARHRIITAHRASNIDELARQIVQELVLGLQEQEAMNAIQAASPRD